MKNRKGFTLIELLAVIVILAIIALIAVPIVLNMISQARKNAAKSSALGYIDSIEYYSGFNQISDDAGITGYSVSLPTMTNGSVTCTKTTSGWNNECSAFFDAVDAKSKGDKPKTATIVISSTGKVLGGTTMRFGKYDVNYDGKGATVSGESNPSNNNNQVPTYAVGSLVYFDPVSTNQCDSSHTTSETCYKWRVISTDGDNATVQLDHNLVNKSAWAPLDNSTGPTTALTSLANATVDWTRVSGLNYTYDTTSSTNNYGVLSCDNGICNKIVNNIETLVAGTIEKPVRTRLITGEEISTITKNAGATNDSNAGAWTLSSSNSNWYYFSNNGYIIGTQTSGTNDKALSWLIENTTVNTASGATSKGATNSGYWTLSPVSGNSNTTWYVRDFGYLGSYHVDYESSFGLRPVITMPKSVFN